MIEKIVSKHKLSEWSEIKDDLRYWLSKTLQERIEAVEFLRILKKAALWRFTKTSKDC
jgi:hypothetical protein